jgi:hypothetical protein
MMQFLSKALQHPEMLQSLVGARQQRFDGSVQGARHTIQQDCWLRRVATVQWLFLYADQLQASWDAAGMQLMCASCRLWTLLHIQAARS